MTDSYCAASSSADLPSEAYTSAMVVFATPPIEIATSPPVASNAAMDALIAWACSCSESGSSAVSPAQARLPSESACMNPRLT